MQSKLDSLQVWYFEIQEKSHSRSELLQQALCNAKIFGEDEVELMNWLNEVHGKLSKLSVQDHSPEALWRQRAELRALQEDILLRKQSVDQALLNGLELLKQTTGEIRVIRGLGLSAGSIPQRCLGSLKDEARKTKPLQTFEAALRCCPVEWLGNRSRGLRMGSHLNPWWTPCVLLIAQSAWHGHWPEKSAL